MKFAIKILITLLLVHQRALAHPSDALGLALQNKAKNALEKRLALHYQKAQLRPLSLPKNQEGVLADFTPEINISYPVSNHVVVWLKNESQRIAIWFQVRAYTGVLVARHRIPPHTQIEALDFYWQIRNIAGVRGKPATGLPKNSCLKTSIEKNAILLANHIKALPLISQGELVKLHFRNHQLSLIMETQALTDGNLGETIAVKNTLNQKSLLAKVTGWQQAELVA